MMSINGLASIEMCINIALIHVKHVEYKHCYITVYIIYRETFVECGKCINIVKTLKQKLLKLNKC